jgi:hypothetical protein
MNNNQIRYKIKEEAYLNNNLIHLFYDGCCYY